MNMTSSGPTAIYTRISEDRDGDRLGVQRQEADCRKLASRLGWKVGAVYEDNDISAMKVGKRPAYNRLLADIEAGKVQRLVVYRTDRLYRRTRELNHLIEVIGEARAVVDIRTVQSGELDLSTANGRMMARILGATAEGEVETLKERISRKMDQLRANGEFTGGPRPFGWKVEAGQYIEVPKEIRALETAVSRLLEGDNVHAIVIDLRDQGMRTPRGKILTDTALTTMLQSHRMVGVTAAGVKAPWRALVTPKDHEKIRLLLKPRRRGRPATSYLLTGEILRCGRCGGPMYGARTFAGKADPHYSCKKLVTGGCGRIAIDVDFCDTQVMEAVVEHLTGYLYPPKVGGVRPHKARKLAESSKLGDARLALGRVQAEMDDLSAAVASGSFTVKQAAEMNRGLNVRLEAAKKELQAAEANAAGLSALAQLDTPAFVRKWESFGLVERRRVVGAVVKEIRVQPHSGAFHVKDYSRVQVTFKPVE